MNKNLKTALKSLSKQRRKVAIKRMEIHKQNKIWVWIDNGFKFVARWSKYDLCGKMFRELKEFSEKFKALDDGDLKWV